MVLFWSGYTAQAVQITEILVPDERQIYLVVFIGRVFHQRFDIVSFVCLVGPRLAVVRHGVVVQNAAVEIVTLFVEIVARKFESEFFGQRVVETLSDIDVTPPTDTQSSGIRRYDHGQMCIRARHLSDQRDHRFHVIACR